MTLLEFLIKPLQSHFSPPFFSAGCSRGKHFHLIFRDEKQQGKRLWLKMGRGRGDGDVGTGTRGREFGDVGRELGDAWGRESGHART